MEIHISAGGPSFTLGDRSTSDVVVRLRTPEGRDEWLYCHSSILTNKSKYFADRLSDSWPTCQILDARNCVEVNCQEFDFDYNITVLRLLYVVSDSLISDSWHGVRNALGVLRVGVDLGCPKIVSCCVEYLEAVPWEEAEEEEILRTIPSMGPTTSPILARLQPVDEDPILRIFLSAIQFATSSPPSSLHDLKSSTQEQIEYMITEDDDAPLIVACEKINTEVRQCMKSMLSRFVGFIQSFSCEIKGAHFEAEECDLLQSYLSDLLWASQISAKLEIMRDIVASWVDLSHAVLNIIEETSCKVETLEIKLKVIEVTTKILEAIGYGNVVLPTAMRLHMVKLWLPFARATKPVIDAASNEDDDNVRLKVDCEIWQNLESAFVSIILALPSHEQADILREWLGCEHVNYPDLTEAFEVWCYRCKVAPKRLALFGAPVG